MILILVQQCDQKHVSIITTIWDAECLISRDAPVLHFFQQVLIILQVVVSVDGIVPQWTQIVCTGPRRHLAYSQSGVKVLEQALRDPTRVRGTAAADFHSNLAPPRISCEFHKCHPEEQLIY